MERGLLRKVIRIRAEDSPNVRYALKQHANGQRPTGCDENGNPICPGVLTWDEYVERRQSWDKIRQTIGLDALFYEGAELLLFPPEWLDRAERFDRWLLDNRVVRRAKTIGVDPGEGGAKSSWCVGDEYGVMPGGLRSHLTPDTTFIPEYTIRLMTEFNVKPEDVLFDRGGGGKQHADILRSRGYWVRTVGFGESVQMEPHRAVVPSLRTLKDMREQSYEYRSRRAQMYWEAAELFDPARKSLYAAAGVDKPEAFAIPPSIRGKQDDPTTELRSQLAPIPKWYDNEQRAFLPPKRPNPTQKEENQITMTKLIGHSPDEADAFVLMVHGLLHKTTATVAGGVSRNR